MPKAKKLPSGNWRVRIFAGKDKEGKGIYKSFTDPDKKKVEFQAAEYAVSRKRENSTENWSFDKALDKYLDSKSNLLSPATIRGYRILQRNCFALIKNEPLGKLASNDLIQKQMNENAKAYSAKSITNQFGLITAVMNYHGFNISKVNLKPKEDKHILVPTKKDAEKIMVLLQTDPSIECQALLALTCSLRQSEIAALHARNISGKTVDVHGARVPNEESKLVYKSTNKSKAGARKVTMPDYLAERIQEMCKDLKPDDLIFNMTPGNVLKRFKKLLANNGLPPYTIHSLRHCFAAIMHARNVPDKYVMDMGGWSSDNVLKRVYQYTFEEETIKAKEEVNNYFDNLYDTKHDTK
ncbi:MAG TPA: site-specific integrase [Oscillospiraceae bacterium]|nr:site-specific integrase [Oscillospiraceae bacterium]